MNDTKPLVLRTLLGASPTTQALKSGAIRSDSVEFDFGGIDRASSAFKRVVRDNEFDVAELAIVTFLIAKAHGKPLALLPAVTAGRFQHPYIAYNAERGELKPEDLAGCRVAMRSYSVTTAMWVRGILQDTYKLDLDRVSWVTCEDPHVLEFKDPPNAERAPAGSDPVAMLLDGKVDAAVVGDGPLDPRLKHLIADPDAAAREWGLLNDAIQVNHVMVVKPSLLQSDPAAVREVYSLLKASRDAQASDEPRLPFGLEANRRNLEIAIDYVYRQGMIPRRFSVDELFDDVTRTLD